MEEIKRYRNSFIFLTLVTVIGIMAGLYLYEYTDFFASLTVVEGSVLTSEFDLKEFMLVYFDELKLFALLFIFGFTLFASYISALILAYKGFFTSFCVLYFGMYYECGGINKTKFILMASVLVLMLMLYIIAGAKAIAFSGSLRYCAPDIAAILRLNGTGRYLVTFLLLCCFLLITALSKYSIPLL